MHGWYPDYFFHKGGMVNFTRFTVGAVHRASFWIRRQHHRLSGFQK